MLDTKKVIVPLEYSDYANVFLEASATELPKHTSINDYSINLVDDKQSLYNPIYSLEPVEFEMLKTYIKTNLANGFIRPSQLLARASILFIKKKIGSFQLYVNY